jgi:hypothetical protein
MVTSHKIVTRLKQKLKTLAILAVSPYPPVGICNVFKWEMGLPHILEAMVLFIEQKAMEIFPNKP